MPSQRLIVSISLIAGLLWITDLNQLLEAVRSVHWAFLLAGFFLPLVALAGLFGMNVDLPKFIQPMFWGIFFGGMIFGLGLLYLVGRKTGEDED